MCAVANIVKGGGPVEELCDLVKQVWLTCKELSIQLVPRWQRREVEGMKKADILSKVGTHWELREEWGREMAEQWGLEVMIPDVSDAKAKLMKTVAAQREVVLVLPRWEGQAWWKVVTDNARLVDIPDMTKVVHGNAFGYPIWGFVAAVFGKIK